MKHKRLRYRGCRALFGIIDYIDFSEDYNKTYQPEYYHCVSINDEALDCWWNGLREMKSYYHSMDRPATALARCGVTLIPSESLDLFIETIKIAINKKAKRAFRAQIHWCRDAIKIIKILKQAKAEQKYVIHYGV